MDYDFNQERQVAYATLTQVDVVKKIQHFISGIWQIHPFLEGNTRTVTVFLIQYLREFGFDIDNTPFQQHSKYFRDALVLDNAKILQRRPEFLTAFFENLLLGGQNDLSSEKMYLDLDLDLS